MKELGFLFYRQEATRKSAYEKDRPEIREMYFELPLTVNGIWWQPAVLLKKEILPQTKDRNTLYDYADAYRPFAMKGALIYYEQHLLACGCDGYAKEINMGDHYITSDLLLDYQSIRSVTLLRRDLSSMEGEQVLEESSDSYNAPVET